MSIRKIITLKYNLKEVGKFSKIIKYRPHMTSKILDAIHSCRHLNWYATHLCRHATYIFGMQLSYVNIQLDYVKMRDKYIDIQGKVANGDMLTCIST
jgi:hypothetical protein